MPDADNWLEGQYKVYGHRQAEHEDLNVDTPDDQRVGNTVLIYATDDRFEARRLVNVEGGFVRDGVHYVAVWAKDTEGGGTIGDVPKEASA